ncbi:MAG TPA: DUF2975 domain-containing protein [Phenylobacterium sp.]|nr:DUF2975 domain-containing protein [Phenylobacterium sp.]
MRALGPGSVSSFLKVILDVAFFALWVGVAALGLIALLAILLSFNPDLMGNVTITSDEDLMQRGPYLAAGLLAAALYVGGVLVIVGELRRIFSTLTAGDPFHPDNVTRLRIIGGMLAALEIGRHIVAELSRMLIDAEIRSVDSGLNLTAWFAVLVVFVLAEVFREGARLRTEAELTI